MSLRVTRVFGHASVQGPYRKDRRKFGVPQGGAFDVHSQLIANALAGNPGEAPVLELGMCQAEFVSDAEALIGLAGGPVSLSVDGIRIQDYSVRVHAGAVISIASPEVGARRWMAVSGGLLVRSIPVIASGDVLLTAAPSGISLVPLKMPEQSCAPYGLLRAVPERGEFRQLFENRYVVRHDSNRVGIRLDGPRMAHRMELPSEPAVTGVVQVTPDGLPIILGPDGPTIGGYPRAAVVPSVDWDRLAQLRPGDEVRFVRTTVAAARRARLAADHANANLLASICGM